MDEVACDQFTDGNCLEATITGHLDGKVLVLFSQQVERAVCPPFQEEADAGSDECGDQDAGRFSDAQPVTHRDALVGACGQRQDCTGQQDADGGIVELAEELPPQRFLAGGCDVVAAIQLAVACDLVCGKPVVQIRTQVKRPGHDALVCVCHRCSSVHAGRPGYATRPP